MNKLTFWIMAMVIISSAVAEEEHPSENQLVPVEEEQADGRACHDCQGGDAFHQAYNDQHYSTSQVHQYKDKMDLSWLWGAGGVALSILPILAVNIVGVVLLAILLKHIGTLAEPAPVYQPAYAYSYQGFDSNAGGGFGGPTVAAGGHHGAAAGGHHGGAAGGHHGGGAGGYSKRSTDDQMGSFADPATLQFLSNLVGKAIEKYSNIEAEN